MVLMGSNVTLSLQSSFTCKKKKHSRTIKKIKREKWGGADAKDLTALNVYCFALSYMVFLSIVLKK